MKQNELLEIGKKLLKQEKIQETMHTQPKKKSR